MRPVKHILIVAVRDDLNHARQAVSDSASFRWREFIHFEEVQSISSLSRNHINDCVAGNTDQVVKICTERHFQRIIFLGDLNLDIDFDDLKSGIARYEDIQFAFPKSVKAYRRKIDEWLKNCELHWLSHANAECAKSSLSSCHVNLWVEQFVRLGYKEIAKNLLRNLVVIDDATLTQSFRISTGETIGHRVKHAYIKDDEQGSSSIKIKNVLEHMHAETIFELDLTKSIDFASLQVDIIYVYEDGLWSGVELVKRLNLISEMESFKNSVTQFHFVFGATSDVGLVAARFFANRNGLSRFQFFAGKNGRHFKFLKNGTDKLFGNFAQKDDDAIRIELDRAVDPYAFQSSEFWGELKDQAVTFCGDIGVQLVKPFLKRREMQKTAVKSNDSPIVDIEIKDTKAIKWQLGALGYASTIVFSSSIPKPVLPLFWLQGQVTLNNNSVHWKPLFWDARRTGEADANEFQQ